MITKFPYDPIDYDKYLNAYFQREDAVTRLPNEAELKEIARKGIVKEQLVLQTLPEGACAEIGDTLVIATVSELPKFNKPRVTVTIGRGLYDKTLEAALAGKKVGEGCTVTVKEKQVEASVLEIKRKVVPEPTDEMVVALQAKDYHGNLITTVADYEAFIAQDKIMSELANVNYYVMEAVIADHPMTEYDEEDIRILGELEKAFFIKMFREREGIDILKKTKEEMQELLHCDSIDDFIKLRYEWYKMKIQQCLIFGNILGIPMEGNFDPVSRYEVLSDLQMMMFDMIKEKINRRNK